MAKIVEENEHVGQLILHGLMLYPQKLVKALRELMKWRGLESSHVSLGDMKWPDVVLIHLMKQVCMKEAWIKRKLLLRPASIGDDSVSGDLLEFVGKLVMGKSRPHIA